MGVLRSVTGGVYSGHMSALPLPTTLSPSKISSFTSCALAFRFSAIDKLPEPPSRAASCGSLVHLALQHLMRLEAPERTLEAGLDCLAAAIDEFALTDDFLGLSLDDDEQLSFFDDAEGAVRRYFTLEDPRGVNPIGLELQVETEINGLRLRGIIDRLDLTPDGDLVVTDYKSGRAPGANFENGRLGGVHFYSLVCEEMFGVRPARVQLYYLADPIAIIATPDDQSTRALKRKVAAIWTAVERACATESFRPRQSKLCDWCNFKQYCPEFGGDPASVPVEFRTAGRPGASPAVASAAV